MRKLGVLFYKTTFFGFGCGNFKFGFVELFVVYFSVNSDRKVPKEHRQRAKRPLDTRFPYMGLFDRGYTRRRFEKRSA